jgi:multiple sugar transport system permease protein
MNDRSLHRYPSSLAFFLLILTLAHPYLAARGDVQTPSAEQSPPKEKITLRAYGVPFEFGVGVVAESERMVIDAFRAKYPWIDPVSTTGLELPGSRTMDMVPFMQIAGDIAPDAMYVNFRQSHTYIYMKLLYPLDQYVEQLANARIPMSSTLRNDEYVEQLKTGSNYIEIERRVPMPMWEVMRRECPYGVECPYVKEWGQTPQPRHRHIWSYPVGPLVIGMKFMKTLLSEQGLEQRAPQDWEELMRWAKLMHNPGKQEFGVEVSLDAPGWTFLSFLYSAGGRVVEEEEDGTWVCKLDSEEAAEAAYFYARLKFEKYRKDGVDYEGVIASSSKSAGGEMQYALGFAYLDSRFLQGAEDRIYGFGPVPKGPTGIRGSEFNSRMMGIFAGLADNVPKRDATWNYILFYDGDEARKIHTEKLVQAGMGEFVRPDLLREFNTEGRFDDILRQIPPGIEETYRLATEGGVPEPYGKNCQFVYDQMAKPLGEILSRESIRGAIHAGDKEAAMKEIREILKRGAVKINQRMLGNLPPEIQTRRNIVAWIVIGAVIVIFVVVLRKVFQAFRPPDQLETDSWQFSRYRWAYVLMAPAILTISLWMYWPLAKGSVIAFQDYSVLGDSIFVGAQNFANVLYDPEFWASLKVSLIYAIMFMIFGFWAPIGLAFLLQEVPTGKVLFRTIYYLPAVLSGVVVIFLWRAFYNPDGMINELLNGGVVMINYVFGSNIEMFKENWLDNPTFALFFCLLPSIWAGLGPGCLIYLAALKTIPEEHYEAADIDGAGVWRKIFSIALPSIRTLVTINFIGAMITAIRGAGAFILAMTGGGPFGENGGATEVIGLKLFYTTFGYLQFGPGAAMAWVLGSMLIGFTVMQLQRLSKLEFRTAEKAA